MGKIIETKINRFDGGIVNDPRDPSTNTAQMVTNFDIASDQHRMIPYHGSESGDSAASTSQKQNFTIALRTGTTYRLYGLGVVSGATRAEVLMKDLTTSSNDLADDGWLTPANNQSSSGATSFNLFAYYKKTGLIYGARAGTSIWAFDPTSVAVWNDTARSLTYTNIAQGLVASDDILYIPYDNKIASNNNGTWTDVALTLPSHLYITSICEYGNYIAIACAPLSGIGNSQVFLWDKTATSWNEQINFGSGVLKVLEEVGGYLIAILLVGGTTTSKKDRVLFKYLSGNRSEKFKEITGTTSTLMPIAKQKVDNRVYFMMSIVKNGTRREGVWSIGKATPSSPLALTHERTPNNDTALVNGSLYGFFIVGDFMFISYATNSAFALSKTIEPSSYGSNSIYESTKYDNGDISLVKKLLGCTVTYEPQDGGSVTMKYRIQGETSYTTIFTHTATTTTNSHSAVNIESTGATLPEYKEIDFQIISTGGVVVTGYSFKGEIVGKRNYE